MMSVDECILCLSLADVMKLPKEKTDSDVLCNNRRVRCVFLTFCKVDLLNVFNILMLYYG
jgi:hypothetical protein